MWHGIFLKIPSCSHSLAHLLTLLVQAKERELNKLQLEIIILNQSRGNLEQKLHSNDIIKEEKDLLKMNQEKEDAKHWVVKIGR